MNDSTSLNYKNNNDILAAYAEYSLHANKLSGKAGLRYEHTWQSVKYIKGIGSDFNLNYGNLVPSANISYSLGQSSNIGLTYNLRISRPGISMLNPYVDKSDPTALSYGNTNLKCEEAHNISAVYNLFTSKWMVNLTLRQSFCNNAIEQYSFYKNNLLNTTYGNVGKNSRTGLNAYINWNATPKTRFTFNGSVSYNDMRSDALGYSNSGWQSSIMCGLQQTLPWKVRASLNLMSSTKSYNLQGYSTGFNALMGSLSRSFCKDRLNISVFGLTPLSGSTINMKSYTTGKNYINRSDMEFPLRILSFSLSYTFGRQTMVKKAQHTITNEDIKNTESKSESVGNMIEK
jgi:outer membrane receptor protein involved in Fe transport